MSGHSWFRILPCEWNVQFHARINTVHKCIPTIFPTSLPGSKILTYVLHKVNLYENCIIYVFHKIDVRNIFLHKCLHIILNCFNKKNHFDLISHFVFISIHTYTYIDMRI